MIQPRATATLLLATLTCLAAIPVQASNNYQFSCTRGFDQKRTYTTYVRSQDNKRPIIYWRQTVGGISPQERCQQITPRLQQAHNQGRLNIITNGVMQGQPVVCTTKAYGGPCDMLLMTAASGNDVLKIVDELKDALSGRSLGPMRHSSATSSVYYQLDLEESLRNSPIE